MDMIVRRAKLRGRKGLVDIAVERGKIARISSRIAGKARTEINAAGKLVTPTFVDPHLHLDKALISEVVRENKSGTLREAIEIIWDKKKKYTIEDNVVRATRVIEWGVKHGTTVFRSHVDVDSIGGLKPLKGVLEARKQCADIADVQLVAFPQEGILQDPGCEELMREAMELGADVVGGMPHNEMTDDDSQRHIDICFEIAKEYDADIDMHVDETDDINSRCLQYLAAKTIRENYQGRVSTGHTCALGSYDPYYAAKVIDLVKRAGINMVTNPATNLMLEGRLDRGPIRRGLTRVKDLLAAGVNVVYGQDCLKDTFYPTWGQEDMLEVGLIAAHAIQFTWPREIETLFDMPTVRSAQMLRLKGYGIEAGNPASFNVLDATTVQEAFRTQADRLYVIRKGKLLAETRTSSKIYRNK
ncbi:MAG: amidohydrolase family protein [Candidatus Aureabacteria bacterium]|nr:amidohydrolase family protein [Candidatus Auribacterota bacterium]